jgi:ATP-binding cassette subfamily B protein
MPSEIDEFLQHEEPSTLIGSSLYRKVEPGEIIFLEGQPGDAAYVIRSGEVQVASQDMNGNFVIINRMKAGEMFGEIALLSDERVRTATVISEKGCELFVIDKSVFEEYLKNADSTLRYFISHLCKHIIGLTHRIRDLSSPDA